MFTRPGKVREQQNMNSSLIGTLFAGHFESFHRHTLHSFKLINIQRLHGYTFICMRGSNQLVKIFKLPVACRFLLGKILFYHIQYNYTYTSLHQKRVVQYSHKFMHGIVYCCKLYPPNNRLTVQYNREQSNNTMSCIHVDFCPTLFSCD